MCYSCAFQVGDYGSAVANYAIIGFAVFHAGFFSADSSKGDAASRISLASFYLIMVANAMTSVLDVSRSAGELAGHAARICDFVRAMAQRSSSRFQGPDAGTLHSWPLPQQHPLLQHRDAPELLHHGQTLFPLRPAAHSAFIGTQKAQESTLRIHSSRSQRIPGDSARELLPLWGASTAPPASVVSAFGAILPDSLRDQTVQLLAQTPAQAPGGCPLDVSVHTIETGQLRDVIGHVFVDMPVAGGVLALCTFQPVNAAAMRSRQVRQPPSFEASDRAACSSSIRRLWSLQHWRCKWHCS